MTSPGDVSTLISHAGTGHPIVALRWRAPLQNGAQVVDDG